MNQVLSTSRIVRNVLFGGLTAGSLDITYAMTATTLRGRPPALAVKAVASGLLGRAALEGGASMFVLGLALHFFIALSAALLYYLASTRLALLRERVLVPGAVFGVSVYLVMNFVVLPLSAAPFKLSYPPLTLALGLLVHVVCIGWPIAAFVRRAWAGTRTAT